MSPSPQQAPAAKTENLDAMSVSEAGLPESSFPGEFQREFRVCFDEKIHDEIVKHAAETTDLELCGVLVGRLVRDRYGPFLTITGSIRGEHAQNDGAQVKFTHATWDHIHEVKDKQFPKDAIVGWYHTHPGFGIFLSSMDTFIQEYFFNAAQQVALVVDPRSGEEGIFVWRAGKIERSSRFWIGSRERPCAAGPIDSRPAPPRPQGHGRAPAAPTGAAPEAAGGDEIDFGELARKAFPYAIGILLGVLCARVAGSFEVGLMKDDLVRAEVRNLVGDAAQAWSAADDLGAIEKDLSSVIASVSTATGGGNRNVEPDLRELQKRVVDLKKVAGAREDAIAREIHRRGSLNATLGDQVRTASRDSALARDLALQSFLAVLRMKLDVLGKDLSAKEKDAIRQAIEEAFAASDTSDTVREKLRARFFPDLYEKKPPEPQGPK